MDVDINTLRGLATIFCIVAFAAVVIWAYSDRRRDDFDEASKLPFEDKPDHTGVNSATLAHKPKCQNNKESGHV